MGGTLSTSKPVVVFLDSGFYRPGDEVSGSVCVSDAAQYTHLHLKVEGIETTKWRISDAGSESSTREREFRDGSGPSVYQGTHTVFKEEVPLHKYTTGAGQQQHPFHFQLPQNIPGTFLFQSPSCQASVTYAVTACLHNERSLMNWTGKHTARAELIVLPAPPPPLPLARRPLRREQRTRVAAALGCVMPCLPCVGQGHARATAELERNTVTPGDALPVSVTVQNQSSAALTVRVILRRTVTLRSYRGGAQPYTHVETDDVFSAQQTGPSHRDLATRSYSLLVQTEGALEPTLEGALVSCTYALLVEATPGGHCCPRGVALEFPIHVYGAASGYEHELPPVPTEWHPTVFPDQLLELPGPPMSPPTANRYSVVQPSAPPLAGASGLGSDHSGACGTRGPICRHPSPSAPPPQAATRSESSDLISSYRKPGESALQAATRIPHTPYQPGLTEEQEPLLP